MARPLESAGTERRLVTQRQQITIRHQRLPAPFTMQQKLLKERSTCHQTRRKTKSWVGSRCLESLDPSCLADCNSNRRGTARGMILSRRESRLRVYFSIARVILRTAPGFYLTRTWIEYSLRRFYFAAPTDSKIILVLTKDGAKEGEPGRYLYGARCQSSIEPHWHHIITSEP